MTAKLELRRSVLALAIVISVGGAACGGGGAGDGDPGATDGGSGPITASTEEQDGGPATTNSAGTVTTNGAEARPDPDGGAAGDAAIEVEVVDEGDEPHIALGMSANGPASVSIIASATDSGQVGDDRFERLSSRSYDLTVGVEEGDSGTFDVTIVPRVTEALPAIPIEPGDTYEPWEWSVASGGAIITTDQPEPADARLRELSALVAAPELFAVVPTQTIGLGATWRFRTVGEPDALVNAELVAIDDEIITISYDFVAESDGTTLDFASSGTYDRTTLMVREVTAESTFAFTAETTNNGQPEAVSGTYQLERTYLGGQ